MIQSLLGTFGMLGIVFGMFGFAIAGSWLCGGCPTDAADIRGNARLLLLTGTTLLVFAAANTA